jgi:pimeloyl-ACP methyl ester carboxylesterase
MNAPPAAQVVANCQTGSKYVPGRAGKLRPLRTLVLLSGLLCDETFWADAAERVAGAAHVRIVAFPGFDAITAMAAYVLSNAPERFAIAGHSMGGRVALEVVRQAPQRIEGLALFNTGVHPRREEEVQSRGGLVKLAREQGMSALAAKWLPPMMGASPARIAQVMPMLTAMVERATPDSFAAQISALLDRPDAACVLPLIDVPTLLASGTGDTWSPLAQHHDMLRHIPRATLVAIEDAGHMSPVEQPDAVATAIRSWLGQL